MTDEPVRRYEFGLYREDVNRRLGRLEDDVKRLDAEHETDMDNLAKQEREGRWTWPKILAALAAAATVGGFYLEARGGR